MRHTHSALRAALGGILLLSACSEQALGPSSSPDIKECLLQAGIPLDPTLPGKKDDGPRLGSPGSCSTAASRSTGTGSR